MTDWCDGTATAAETVFGARGLCRKSEPYYFAAGVFIVAAMLTGDSPAAENGLGDGDIDGDDHRCGLGPDTSAGRGWRC